MSEADLPEGFEAWPKAIQQKYLEELHALYFPKLRWWEKPETLTRTAGRDQSNSHLIIPGIPSLTCRVTTAAARQAPPETATRSDLRLQGQP